MSPGGDTCVVLDVETADGFRFARESRSPPSAAAGDRDHEVSLSPMHPWVELRSCGHEKASAESDHGKAWEPGTLRYLRDPLPCELGLRLGLPTEGH